MPNTVTQGTCHFDDFSRLVDDLRREHAGIMQRRVRWLARIGATLYGYLVGDDIPPKTVQRWADCLDAVAERGIIDVALAEEMIGGVVQCHLAYRTAHPELQHPVSAASPQHSRALQAAPDPVIHDDADGG